MSSETALPQAVQERIAIRARQDAMALGFEFDADLAGVSAIERTLSRAMLAAVAEALEGRAQAPAPDCEAFRAAIIADFNTRLTRESVTIIPGLAFAIGLLEQRRVPAPSSTGAATGGPTP